MALPAGEDVSGFEVHLGSRCVSRLVSVDSGYWRGARASFMLAADMLTATLMLGLASLPLTLAVSLLCDGRTVGSGLLSDSCHSVSLTGF